MKDIVVNALKSVLPIRLKKQILHLAFHLAPEEFGEFAYLHCIAPSMTCAMKLLAQRGFSPRTIVDVGAYEGDWTRSTKRIWPLSEMILIEANQAYIEKLNRLGRAYCAVLGAEDGITVTFNVMQSGSSVFSENSSIPRSKETRTLQTLDSLRFNIEMPALLKIDAQGYELEILKGAKQKIRSFEAVLLEVALVPMNDGAPLLRDVVDYMDRISFVACDLMEAHRRPSDGALSQIDLLFARQGSNLLADKPYS